MNQQERFDQVLNESLDRLFKGEALDRILADYPDLVKELEPLLRTAGASRAFSQIQPRPDFKSRARYEFLAAARELEAKPRRRSLFHWRWQSAWSISLAAVVLVVLAGAGTVAASISSLPGQSLYKVKITTEKVQLAFAFSDVTKTELNAKFANRRTIEIEDLATTGDTGQIQLAAANLSNNLTNLSKLTQGDLPLADTSGPSPANALMFNTETASNNEIGKASGSNATGGGASDSAPVVTANSARKAVIPDSETPPTPVTLMLAPAPQSASGAGLEQSDNQVQALASSDTQNAALPAPVSSESIEVTSTDRKLSKNEQIREIIEKNYQERQSRLQAALEKAKPELRQAIKQALAQSEFEYWKSIQNLDRNTNQE
jgi:hypothetical protein